MNAKLVVGNKAQQALFIGEIQGQLSDGMWENTNPQNHWIAWCELDGTSVVVAKGIEKVGRNFYAVKDNYSLSSKALLDCVGDRMIWLVKLVQSSVAVQNLVVNGNYWNLFKNLAEYETAYNKFSTGTADKYTEDKILKLAELGINLSTYKSAEYFPYDLSSLRKDLHGLSVAMKTMLK